MNDDDERQLIEFSVIKFQSFIRLFLVRCKLLKAINSRYEKIYDPRRQKHYYYDKEKDTSSWNKPVLLLNGDVERVAPTYLDDQAATMIQTRIRMVLALLRVRLLYQSILITSVDEASGANYYYNPRSEVTMWDLPYFMNNRLDYERKKPQNKATKIARKSVLKRGRKNSTATGTHVDGSGSNDSDISDEDEDDDGGDTMGNGETAGGEGRDAGGGRPDHDEESTATGLSDSSEAMREKRRLLRNYPRSKVQARVDAVEDHVRETVELDLSRIGAARFSSRLYDLDALRALDLSHNRLSRLSPDIQYLGNLTQLNVSHNRLESLPKELGEALHALTDLNLAHNRIAYYPGQTYKMKKLRSLDLSHNRLKAIPVETGNLELLKDLGQWDVGVGLLQQLTRLDVSHNAIADWPPQIDRLLHLAHLDLSHNQLAVVPSLLGCLTALEHLDLRNNAIRSLPSELYELGRLKFLALHNNAVPDWAPFHSTSEHRLVTLPHLRELDMSHNALVLVDRRMDIMRYLERLTLSHNRISRFIGGDTDDCMAQLTALTFLDLSHNAITELTASIGACALLTHIDLSHNALTEIPAAFIKLTRLVSVNLSHNEIAEASGKVFAMLGDLERLEMQHNRLAALPPLLYTLRKVRRMDLSRNRIPLLLDSLEQLVGLTHLNVSYNELVELPAAVSGLSQLTILELKSNRITALPTSISQLRRLRRITLSRNDLAASPALLAVLPQLVSCNLSWNLRLAGHNVDHVAATKAHSHTSGHFFTAHILQRKLRALTEKVDVLLARPRARQPVYVHEQQNTVTDREEYAALMMGDGCDSEGGDDGDEGDTRAVGPGRKAPTAIKGKAVMSTNKAKRSKLTPGQRTLQWLDKLKRHFAEHVIQPTQESATNAADSVQFPSSAVTVTSGNGADDRLTVAALQSKESRQCSLHLSFLLQRIDACRGRPTRCREFIHSDTASPDTVAAFDRSVVEACLERQGAADWQAAVEGYQSLLHEANALSLVLYAKDMALHPLEVDEEVFSDGEENTVVPPGSAGGGRRNSQRSQQIDKNARRNSSQSRRNSSSRRREQQQQHQQGKKLLDLAFGVDGGDVLSARNITKDTLMHGLPLARIPPILHYSRVLDSTVVPLGGGRRDPVPNSAKDALTSHIFACYTGLARVLVARAECLAESIRQVELRGQLASSSLDLAQRAVGGWDYHDLLSDVYDDLVAGIAARETARQSESLAQRKDKNVTALMSSLLDGSGPDQAATGEGNNGGAEDDEATSAAPSNANERLLSASVDKMMAKDPENAVTPPARPVTLTPLSQIMPPMTPSEWVPTSPLSPSCARGCVAFLSAHRALVLHWASMCLDIADGLLKANGWDLDSASFSPHKAHSRCSESPDWLRQGSMDALRLRAKTCQYLELYSPALDAYRKLTRLKRGADNRGVQAEMLRIHLAQGNYLPAHRLSTDMVERYVPRPAGKTTTTTAPPPDVYEVMRHDRELALLHHYAELCVRTLKERHGVFSEEQSRVYRVQDNGQLSMPADRFAEHSEVKYGRQLTDVRRSRAVKALRAEERRRVDLLESRMEFRSAIDREKDKVRAALRAVAGFAAETAE